MSGPLPAAYLEEFSEPSGYLDFASTGPPSRRVVRATADALEAAHRWGEPVWERMEASLEELARRAGRLLGARPEQVVTVPNTSAGLFAVALGLPPGGNVVVPADDFPANLYPWLRAAEVLAGEVRRVEAPDGRVTADRVAAAVDRHTRAVAVSLVDYRTGFRVDPGALREAAGSALLVIDAIQGLGAVPASLHPADVLVAGGHKWLRAGWGAGLMALSDRALERLGQVMSGWLGVEDELDFSVPPPHPPRPDAGRFRLGSPAAFGAVALTAALELLEEAGVEAVAGAVADRAGTLEEAVRRAGAEVMAPWHGPEERAGILCFRLLGESAVETARRLRGAGLVLTERLGWIRLSPHASTPPDVGDRLAEALAG